MFSNKIKGSDLYFGQPAQNLLLNESDTMIESSQSAPPSGSQKLELSQIPNSQDLFVETPGLELADHEIPSSSYDRYMHFKSFQPYTFPSKKCLQKIPSSSELPDAKSQINEEHSKKLDSIYDVMKEVLEVLKPLKNDVNLIKADILDQKKTLVEMKTSWDDKWNNANNIFKSAHDIMTDIKCLAETTADEIKASKTKFGDLVKDEVSNVKLYLNDYLHDNKRGMHQNADKICMEICKLHDQALSETRDMHHVLAAEVEKILWDHTSRITKQMEDCVAALQDKTSSTLNSIKEVADKWNHGRNDNRPPSQSLYPTSNYNNGYKSQLSDVYSSNSLPLHGHTPIIYQPSPSAYMPFNRNTNSVSLNNTFHHGESSNLKGGGVDSFFDDVHFISKRKQSIRDMIFQKMPPSDHNPRPSVLPYRRKLEPLDMNARVTGQEHFYQNGLRKDDSVQAVTIDSPKPNMIRNAMFIHNDDNIRPIESKFKVDPKRIKVETKYLQSASENMNTKMCKTTKVTSPPNSKCSPDSKVNGRNTLSTPNSKKVYMLRSQRKSCNNKENNSIQYRERDASMIKDDRFIKNDDSSDSCVIIDD